MTTQKCGLDGRGLNTCEGEIFCAVQTDLKAHPASCTMGTGSFPWVKQLQHNIDHLPPSTAMLQMGWSYKILPPPVSAQACHGVYLSLQYCIIQQ